MQRRAIVLIGFMGSGKTCVGAELAQRTGLPCFDTDELVVARSGQSIAEIFAQYGEAEFRNREAAALEEIPEITAIVITGGGVVLRGANVRRLRQLGFLINLTADEETLCQRISKSDPRPLLETGNLRATLSALLYLREPLYREAADFSVDTSQLAPEEVAQTITNWIAAHE